MKLVAHGEGRAQGRAPERKKGRLVWKRVSVASLTANTRGQHADRRAASAAKPELQVPRDGDARRARPRPSASRCDRGSACSPSATRSPTAGASCSGASRCSRGRCGWRAGSGCRSRPTPSTARAGARRARRAGAGVARAQRAPGRAATTSAACTWASTTCAAPDWDRDGVRRRLRARSLDALAARCDRLLLVTIPLDLGRPRAGAPSTEANAVIEAAARERGALVLDLRGFGARNLVMADHVHPTAFGQVWIAERALDGAGGRRHGRARAPVDADRARRAHAHARAAGRLDLRLPALKEPARAARGAAGRARRAA